MHRLIATLARSMSLTAALAASTLALAQEARVVRFLTNETDPAAVAFYTKAIADFEAKNPAIKVEMESVNSDARLKKVAAALNARTMPEVFKLNTEERAEFARKGYLVPLDELAAEIGESDFVPGALTKVDGRVYDLPYALNQFGILCSREDLLKGANLAQAADWPGVVRNAQATTAGDTYGFIFPASEGRLTSIFLAQLMWSAGGTFFDKDFNVTFNSPATVSALKLMKDLAAFSPKGVASYSWGDMVNVYLSGKVAQNLYAPRLIETAAIINKDLLAKTDCVTMPKGPAGIGVTFVSPNNYALAAPQYGAKNTAEAKQFLKYLITADRLRDFSLLVFPHMIPPLKSVQAEVIRTGAAKLGGREGLAQVSFALENGLNFETEAGTTFEGGKVVRSGLVNPFIGPVIARNIPAQVVQRVIINGEDPAKAAAWGEAEMKRIVQDLKRVR